MPYVLTCSLCGRSADVEHFEVMVRLNRSKTPIRIGAGGMEMCSLCWIKYASPTAMVRSWDELMERKIKRLESRKATDLPMPIRRVVNRPNA